MYQQYEEGEANPARILDHFTEEEEHREAASLFHTRIRELTTPEEREKALKETVVQGEGPQHRGGGGPSGPHGYRRGCSG